MASSILVPPLGLNFFSMKLFRSVLLYVGFNISLVLLEKLTIPILTLVLLLIIILSTKLLAAFLAAPILDISQRFRLSYLAQSSIEPDSSMIKTISSVLNESTEYGLALTSRVTFAFLP